MGVIMISREDPAALNIRDSLLARGAWTPCESLDELACEGASGAIASPPDVPEQLHDMLAAKGPSAWRLHGSRCVMMELDGDKLYWEGIDADVRALLPDAGLLILPSRHKSGSGLRTLTVHPTGNFKAADLGGRPGSLSVCAPEPQTRALRIMSRKAKEAGLDHRVSFECTHHGPLLSMPHFFIEIGSDAPAWVEKPSGDVLADTILEFIRAPPAREDPVVVGVGGGHYCPRFSDLVLEKRCSMGHFVPNYQLDCEKGALRQAVDRTPGARFVYFHKKSMKGAAYREMRDWFTSADGGGLAEVRSEDLVDLPH